MPAKFISDQLLKIYIRNTEVVLFDAMAYAVSSVNENGVFDILPSHANFITLIKKKITVYDAGGAEVNFEVDSGVLQVVDNEVTVLLGV